MIYFIIWLSVVVWLFWNRYRKFRKKPWRFANQAEGLTMFTKSQEYCMILFWPISIIGFVLVLIAGIFGFDKHWG